MKPKICINCGKEFTPGKRNYARALSCSAYCNLKQYRAKNPGKSAKVKREWRRRNGVLERGSIEHRLAVSAKNKEVVARGEKHKLWKGDNVGYRALHRWVEGQLGKPDGCEECGRTGLTARKIHWANMSHQYKRDISDWKRLCVKCHKQYDIRRLSCQS